MSRTGKGGVAMATMLRLGRADHGRTMTLEEFLCGDYKGGNKYELIDGKLYVAPAANLPENAVQEWLSFRLKLYGRRRPRIVNFVTGAARVFIPGTPGLTAAEPDVSAYCDFPIELPLRDIRWEDISPFL